MIMDLLISPPHSLETTLPVIKSEILIHRRIDAISLSLEGRILDKGRIYTNRMKQQCFEIKRNVDERLFWKKRIFQRILGGSKDLWYSFWSEILFIRKFLRKFLEIFIKCNGMYCVLCTLCKRTDRSSPSIRGKVERR